MKKKVSSRIEKVLFIEEMPDSVFDKLKKGDYYKDGFLKFISEFEPGNGADYAQTLTLEHIQNYYEQQCKDNVVIYFATKWTINGAVYLYERVQARRAKRESAPEQA